MEKILFVGAGNMGSAIMGGIFKQYDLFALEPNADQRLFLEKNYSIPSFAHPDEIQNWQEWNAIFLAIKPQQLQEVAPCLKVHKNTFVISILAGKTTEHLSAMLKTKKIIRAMPNTPALIHRAVVGLFAHAHTTENEKNLTQKLFEHIGKTLWLNDENQMDAITALSGSGPAYVFYFLESLMYSAQTFGFDESTAKMLALETLLGSGLLAQQQMLPFSQLRENVTSKGGTTEAALNVLKEEHFQNIVHRAILAAQKRSLELNN